MLYGHPVDDGLGFSLNPLHYVKKGAQAVGHEAKAGGKFVVSHAKGIAELAILPVAVLDKAVMGPILHVALTPVRRQVSVMKDRRAKKLAWDRRKSDIPTQAEKNEAKSWTKSTLRHEKIPFGPILSLLAGSGGHSGFGGYGGVGYGGLGALGDPTTATIISSIPVLLQIIKSALAKSNSNGQAPKDPKGGKGGGAGPAAPDAAGDDASAAPAGGDDASAGGDDAAAGGGKHGKHGKGGGAAGGGGGGKLLGLPKKYVIIGGAVLGGVLVLSLLTKKGS